MADGDRPVMPVLLRSTLAAIYGEENVRRMERAARPPANDDQPTTPDELQRIADEAEAARFAAEIERDERLGDDANWPNE